MGLGFSFLRNSQEIHDLTHFLRYSERTKLECKQIGQPLMDILIYTPNVSLQAHLRQVLVAEGYTVQATTYGDVDHLFTMMIPALTIWDVANLRADAGAMTQALREAVQDQALLLLTSRIDADEAAEYLDKGADDLLRQPFDDRELIARVRALLRWSTAIALYQPQLKLSEAQYTVQIDQQTIELTPIEFRLFKALCHSGPQYLNAQQLLSHVWQYAPDTGDVALVRNHIRNLRRKLESDPNRPRILLSRYGQGYRVNALVRLS